MQASLLKRTDPGGYLMNRSRLVIVAGVALLPLAVPEPARAAKGEFEYTTAAEGTHSVRNRSLKEPENGRCHILNTNPSEYRVVRARNKTDVPATVFASDNCTGQSGMIAVGATQNSCGDGTPCWESVRFIPGA